MGRVQIFNVSDVLLGAIFCKPANKTVIIHLWCVWELIRVTQKLHSDFFFFKALILLGQNFCVDISIKAQQKEKKTYTTKQRKILRRDDKK